MNVDCGIDAIELKQRKKQLWELNYGNIPYENHRYVMDRGIDAIGFELQQDKLWGLKMDKPPHKNYRGRLTDDDFVSVSVGEDRQSRSVSLHSFSTSRIHSKYQSLEIKGFLQPHDRKVTRLLRLLCEPRRWKSIEFIDTGDMFYDRSTIYIVTLGLAMRSTDYVILSLKTIDTGICRCIHSAISFSHCGPQSFFLNVQEWGWGNHRKSGPLLALAFANNKCIKKLKIKMYSPESVPSLLQYLLNGLTRNPYMIQELEITQDIFGLSDIQGITEYLKCERNSLVQLSLKGMDLCTFLSCIESVRHDGLEQLTLLGTTERSTLPGIRGGTTERSCMVSPRTPDDRKTPERTRYKDKDLVNIPRSFPMLINLKIAMTSMDDISGFDYYLLNEQSCLESMHLDYNCISADSFRMFCSKIPLMKKVRSLSFTDNHLIPEKGWGTTLETNIVKNKSIDSMECGYNGFICLYLPVTASHLNYNRLNRSLEMVSPNHWPTFLPKILNDDVHSEYGTSPQEQKRSDMLYRFVRNHVEDFVNK